jgi:hypothetical protein
MTLLRYLFFALVGVAAASFVFIVLNFLVSSNFETMTSYVERWIIRATCERYEVHGTVRDAAGVPVPYAVIEVAYLEERLSTRSNTDGSYVIRAAEPECDRVAPANVSVIVVAEGFRPKRQTVPFASATLDVALSSQELRP